MFVKCHLDEAGATDLVVDLVINNHSSRTFEETIELGIALLDGGNCAIQVPNGFLIWWTCGAFWNFLVFIFKPRTKNWWMKTVISDNYQNANPWIWLPKLCASFIQHWCVYLDQMYYVFDWLLFNFRSRFMSGWQMIRILRNSLKCCLIACETPK